MQKGTPTRAPQVVMSTRPGCFPEITCQQLAVLKKAKEVERLDAEVVFLSCPALSEEAGRNLPNPVERSLLSDGILGYLETEEKNRRWAEEKVRQNPDSPALYLFTRWWEGVRYTHEAGRKVAITVGEWKLDLADAGKKKTAKAADALMGAALKEQKARRRALYQCLNSAED